VPVKVALAAAVADPPRRDRRNPRSIRVRCW